MEENGTVDGSGFNKVEIELANKAEVTAFVREVQLAVNDLEAILLRAPVLRFAPKSSLVEISS